VQLCVETQAKHVSIALTGKGRQRRDVENGLQYKMDAIRIDAACSYAWTLGGEFTKGDSSFTLRLNALD